MFINSEITISSNNKERFMKMLSNKKNLLKLIIVLISVYIGLFTVVANAASYDIEGESFQLKKPRLEQGGFTFYDTIYFGNFYQSEIEKGTFTCDEYVNIWGCSEEPDNPDAEDYRQFIINQYNEIVAGGNTENLISYIKYYKKTPIKWRVIDVDEENPSIVTLTTEDEILGDYDPVYNKSVSNICSSFNNNRNFTGWGKSRVRSYLNGYDSSENAAGDDFSGMGFWDVAFSDSEKNAIIPTTVKNTDESTNSSYVSWSDTVDNVRILSVDEVNSKYGFAVDDFYDEKNYNEGGNIGSAGAEASLYALNSQYEGAGTYEDSGQYGDFLKWETYRVPWSTLTIKDSSAYRILNTPITNKAKAETGHGFFRPVITVDLSKAGWSYAGLGTYPKANSLTEAVEERKMEMLYGSKAVANFLVVDTSGNPIANADVWYYVRDPGDTSTINTKGFSTGKTDDKGRIAIEVNGLNLSSLSEGETYSFRRIITLKVGTQYVPKRTLLDVKVLPRKTTQIWNMQGKTDIEAALGLSAGASLGAAEAKWSCGEVAAQGGGGSGLTIVHESTVGKNRRLELIREFSLNAGENAKLGPFVQLGPIEVAGAKISEEVNFAPKNTQKLIIENYDPNNEEQVKKIAAFLIGYEAMLTNNQMCYALSLLVEKDCIDEIGYSYNLSVEGGAEIASVDFGDNIASGSLASGNYAANYEYFVERSLESMSNASRYSMQKESLVSTGIVGYDIKPLGKTGNLFPYGEAANFLTKYGLSADNKEIVVTINNKTSVEGSVLSQKVTEDDINISFTGKNRQKLISENKVINEFSRGAKSMIFDSAVKDVINAVNTGDIVPEYERTTSESEKATLKLAIGANLGVGLKIAPEIAGSHTFTYETERGYIENGVAYSTAVDTTPKTQYKVTLENLVKEAFLCTTEMVKDKIVIVSGKVGEGVKSGLCTIKAVPGKIYKGCENTIIKISSIGHDKKIANVSVVVPVQYKETGSTLAGGAHVSGVGDILDAYAVTIGQGYNISFWHEDGASEYAYCNYATLEIELEYDDEMLKEAGIDSEAEKRIEIFYYDDTLQKYVSVGGQVDTVNNKVTYVTERMNPGQYILAVNAEESYTKPESKDESTSSSSSSSVRTSSTNSSISSSVKSSSTSSSVSSSVRSSSTSSTSSSSTTDTSSTNRKSSSSSSSASNYEPDIEKNSGYGTANDTAPVVKIDKKYHVQPNLSLSQNEITLMKGTKVVVDGLLLDKDALKAYNKEYKKIAALDKKGVISAKGVGEAYIRYDTYVLKVIVWDKPKQGTINLNGENALVSKLSVKLVENQEFEYFLQVPLNADIIIDNKKNALSQVSIKRVSADKTGYLIKGKAENKGAGAITFDICGKKIKLKFAVAKPKI